MKTVVLTILALIMIIFVVNVKKPKRKSFLTDEERIELNKRIEEESKKNELFLLNEEEKTYKVTLMSQKGGYIHYKLNTIFPGGSMETTVPHGQNIIPKLTAFADDDYEFIGWGEFPGVTISFEQDIIPESTAFDDEFVGLGEHTYFNANTNTNADRIIVAEFKPRIYTLIFGSSSGGYISTTRKTFANNLCEKVTHGGISTPVTAIPDGGYKFVGWEEFGFNSYGTKDIFSTDNPLVIYGVAGDNTFTAKFEPK